MLSFSWRLLGDTDRFSHWLDKGSKSALLQWESKEQMCVKRLGFCVRIEGELFLLTDIVKTCTGHWFVSVLCGLWGMRSGGGAACCVVFSWWRYCGAFSFVHTVNTNSSFSFLLFLVWCSCCVHLVCVHFWSSLTFILKSRKSQKLTFDRTATTAVKTVGKKKNRKK